MPLSLGELGHRTAKHVHIRSGLVLFVSKCEAAQMRRHGANLTPGHESERLDRYLGTVL